MKKLRLLIGATVGTVGGMLLSNKNLRKKVKSAKDPKQAAKAIGDELKKSGEDLGKEAKEWIKSDAVQSQVSKAKEYANEKLDDATETAKEMLSGAVGDAKKKFLEGVGKAKNVVSKKGGKK